MFISKRLPHPVLAVLLLALSTLSIFSTAAFAAGDGPGWEVAGQSYPTNFLPHSAVAPQVSGTIVVDLFNVGAEAAGCTNAVQEHEADEHLLQRLCPGRAGVNFPDSNPITVTDVLPPGVRAVEAGEVDELYSGSGIEPSFGHAFWVCSGNGGGPAPGIVGASVITCTNNPGLAPSEAEVFAGGGGPPNYVRSYAGPGQNPQPAVGIAVDVQPGAGEHELNHVSVAGGGAPAAASTSDVVTVSAAEVPFAVTGWDGWFSKADGTLDTQAGSHPYEAEFSLDLATIFNQAHQGPEVTGGEMRTAEVELPPGFVGDPTAVPQCPREQFDAEECPLASMVGTTTVYFANLAPIGLRVFNLVPPPGVPAEFGFSLQGLNTYLDAGVRSGSDYGITEHVSDVAHKDITQAVMILWGDPGDATHNRWRNGLEGGCTQEELDVISEFCTTSQFVGHRPFLTLPTECGVRLPFKVRATSWTGETSERTFYMHDSNNEPDTLNGCGELGFGPLFSLSPDTGNADTPAGLTVDVKPPVGGLENVEGLSTADIKDTTVTLPEGLAINPGQAAGLQVCPPGQDGMTTEAESALGEEDNGPPSCPGASKVGTVKAKTPLLEGSGERELSGDVYVLPSDPPALKLLAAFSADGVNVKLVLNVELNEQTGQITTKVVNIPEFPVSDFKLSFSGGPQAALATPTQCGAYQAGSDFTPWSSPLTPEFTPTAAFSIVAGPSGSGCPTRPLPFSPELIAGATTDQAGGYTGFSMLLRRGDGQQRIERLSFKAPQGLAGMISQVPLCGEPQAAQGACTAGSRIGHATVASGPGPYPLVIPQPGAPEAPIYLTGPYEGAPFGLSIVTPVIAGPFDLGTIITRAKIEVDPRTAQITVTTDALPQIVKGVPTDLRVVDAVIDRPGFMFNPTNCNPQSFSGTGYGSEGAQAPISSHFQVGSCQSLKFAPKFAVSTSGKTSKADGASLTAKLSYPNAAQGTQANITRVKVDLPKQLPSRLTTLQKACTAAQFEANPAGCPSASVIGHARVVTPLLPVPVEGPAYFVSHGGEAFPSLIMLLQGDGVTVELVGTTFISKAGITSSTFKTVPDVPFSTFTLTLGQGKYSALAANLPVKDHGSFCGQKLVMPTAFVAQNGTELHESTKIGVTGCPKAKKAAKKRVKKHAKKKAKKK
jgi:hypothetical protein